MKRLLLVLVGVCALHAKAAAVSSVADCHEILQAEVLAAEEAKAVTAYVEKRYQKRDLSSPKNRVLVQGTADGGGYVLWALRAKSGARVVAYAEKGRSWQLRELGDSGLFVASAKFPNFSAVHFRYDVDGVRLPHERENRFGFESYEWGPDSLKQAGVPTGKLLARGVYKATDKYYPGTERNWWIYVPAQYDPAKPAKLLVFQDGGNYVKGEGNVCTVMDNLIHQGRMPVTIGVFVDPGEIPRDGKAAIRNRGNEYDTCTPKYATFLEEEILPQVYGAYNVSRDAADRCIGGSSSGASCAFTAAWHRNDLYQRVISFVGSYCDFRPLKDYPLTTGEKSEYGPYKTAHDYPALIRKTYPAKKIRIFLQDGRNDLDNTLGNWFKNNERMAAALAFSGYEHQVAWGEGKHSRQHGMAIMPEVLEWVWQ